MIKNISHIYLRYILNYPKYVIILMLLLLAGIASNISNFKLDASADSLILENDKDLAKYRNTIENYNTKDFIVMTLSPNNGDMFEEENIVIIQKLKNALLSIDNIESVITMVDVPLVQSSETPLLEMINNVPTMLSEDIDRDKAKKEILESPIYKELIVSEDGKTTALQINLVSNKRLLELNKIKSDLVAKKINNSITPSELLSFNDIKEQYKVIKNLHDNQTHILLKQVRDIQNKFMSIYMIELRLGGIPMIADDMIIYVKNDLVNFGLGVFIFIVITLVVIFRSIKWVLLPITSCVYAVVFMIGLLGILNWEVTVISSNFISLMLILTLSMNIHLIVRYRQISPLAQNQKEAVYKTTQQMVWPCLYTALTTIVAFASLVLSDIKPVIDFGYMMTLGLIVTFVTSFLLFPSILCLLKKDNKIISTNKPFALTKSLADITIFKGSYVISISLVIFTLTLYGISQLRVENSFINYFKSNTEIYKGMKKIDDELGGTTPLDIIIKFEDKKFSQDTSDDFDADLFEEEEIDPSQEWFTVNKINKIKKVHDYLDSLEETGKVLSLASPIRVAEKLNDNNELDSLELALLYKRVPKEVKDVAISPYVSIEQNQARISVRILDSNPNLRRDDLIKSINNDMQNKLGFKEDAFFLTGVLILYNNMLQSLFDSQILSMGFVMIGIMLMFLILFKSISLSLIGIIPNLLAASFVLGLMGLIKLPLDMMTITIAAIAIGIAVDNSIHYIYRFREEYSMTKNYNESVYRSHDSIGRAIFFTGITIIFGFSILVMSNFIPTIVFGLLTGLAMFIALIAVLTLLPKLLITFKPF